MLSRTSSLLPESANRAIKKMTTSENKTPLAKSSASKWTIAFFSMAIIFSILIFFLPLSKSFLIINVESKASNDSQVFYSKTQKYTQDDSVWQHISPGQNQLSFPLRGSYYSIRWDALNSEGAIAVKDMYVSIMGRRITFDSPLLTPLLDIENIASSKGTTYITTTSGAKDPQVDVRMDFYYIHKIRMIVSSLIGLLLALIIVTALAFRKKIVNILNYFDLSLNGAFKKLSSDGFNIREVGYLIAIGSVCYVYFLSTFSLSIDDEMAAVREDPAVWVSQGRWFVYIVEKLFFPQSSIPFAPYAFLIVTLAISYALILRAHNQAVNWRSYLIYPIFCASPTWWFISEFYSNVPALAFGVLFISLSAYLVFRESNAGFLSSASIFKTLLIITLLSCAIAAYQALILFFICIVFGVLITRATPSQRNTFALLKKTTETLIKSMLLVIASLIVYSLINTFAQEMIAQDNGYISTFVNYEAIRNYPAKVVRLVFNEMVNLYTGDSSRYGVTIGLSAVVIILATINIFFKSNKKDAMIYLALWSGVLGTPFLFNFVSGGVPLPMRTMLSIAYVYWLATLFIINNKRPSLFVLGVAIIVVYQIQIFSANSQYMVSATITQAHDRMLAADIYRRIGEVDESFDRNAPLEIDIFGKKVLKTSYANGWSSAMQGSFFSWDDGNISRMVTYMRIMGYENISVASVSERIAMTPTFREMPIWPAAGSVRKVGGRYLVRLSKEPDPTHAKF